MKKILIISFFLLNLLPVIKDGGWELDSFSCLYAQGVWGENDNIGEIWFGEPPDIGVDDPSNPEYETSEIPGSNPELEIDPDVTPPDYVDPDLISPSDPDDDDPDPEDFPDISFPPEFPDEPGGGGESPDLGTDVPEEEPNTPEPDTPGESGRKPPYGRTEAERDRECEQVKRLNDLTKIPKQYLDSLKSIYNKMQIPQFRGKEMGYLVKRDGTVQNPSFADGGSMSFEPKDKAGYIEAVHTHPLASPVPSPEDLIFLYKEMVLKYGEKVYEFRLSIITQVGIHNICITDIEAFKKFAEKYGVNESSKKLDKDMSIVYEIDEDNSLDQYKSNFINYIKKRNAGLGYIQGDLEDNMGNKLTEPFWRGKDTDEKGKLVDTDC